MNWAYRVVIFESAVDSTKVYDSYYLQPKTLQYPGYEDNFCVVPSVIADYFNSLGCSGWELVCVNADARTRNAMYTFKKQIK